MEWLFGVCVGSFKFFFGRRGCFVVVVVVDDVCDFLFGFFNCCFFVSDYPTLLQLIVLPVKAIDK